MNFQDFFQVRCLFFQLYKDINFEFRFEVKCYYCYNNVLKYDSLLVIKYLYKFYVF